MISQFPENAAGTRHLQSLDCGNGHPITCFAILLSLCLSSGCAALLGKTKGPMDNLDTAGLKQAGYTFGEYGTNKPLTTEDGKPAIVLEVNNGKRHFEKIPLVPGQPMFIADLIRDAKLDKKIGRLQATVLRPNGQNKPPIRMDVDFDDSGKRVMEGQNYSLRSGDHIVISHDNRTAMSEWFSDMIPGVAKGRK